MNREPYKKRGAEKLVVELIILFLSQKSPEARLRHAVKTGNVSSGFGLG